MGELEYTTLEIELARMEGALEKKLEKFEPARHCSLEEQIFHIFKSSSKAHITSVEEDKIYKVIRYYLEKKTPIKVSFLWALYWMAQSPWKFLEPEIIFPRLGDYWAPYWLSLVNSKLKTVYPPGCEFYIIDETEMVKLMGWTREQSNIRKAQLELIYARFDCIRLFDLPVFSTLPEVREVNDQEVVATLVATPKLFNTISEVDMRAIMDTFYYANDPVCSSTTLSTVHMPTTKEADEAIIACHQKSTAEIKKIVQGGVWRQGKLIKTKMNQVAFARRSSGWLDQVVMKNEPFIDAAIINRGAWSPDIWAFTSPQHGGSILDLHNRLYSIKIAPEYRLRESGDYKPIMLRQDNQEYTFYWLPK